MAPHRRDGPLAPPPTPEPAATASSPLLVVTRLPWAGWYAVFGVVGLVASESLFVTFGAWLKDDFDVNDAVLTAATFGLGAMELGASSLRACGPTAGQGARRLGGAFVMMIAAAGLVTLQDWAFPGMVAVALFIGCFEFSIVSAIPIAGGLLPGRPARGLGAADGVVGDRAGDHDDPHDVAVRPSRDRRQRHARGRMGTDRRGDDDPPYASPAPDLACAQRPGNWSSRRRSFLVGRPVPGRAEHRRDVLLTGRRRWAVVDDAFGGERGRHTLDDQLDHLEHPVPVAGPRLDAVADAHRRRRLGRPTVDPHVPRLARIRRNRPRPVHADGPQPDVDPGLLDPPVWRACDTAGVRLDSDRPYHFAVTPAALWSAIAETADYRRWWPWLTGFEANGLVAGDVWRCAVRPPLPYTLRFAIHLDEVVPTTLVTARLSGDIAGRPASR